MERAGGRPAVNASAMPSPLDEGTEAGHAGEALTRAPATVTLSVVVPSRNEAANVGPLFAGLDAALAGVAREYILVDDSDDDTPEVARRLELAAPLRVIHRRRGTRTAGLGGAICTGAAAAQGEWICVMDADLQHPPAAVADLLGVAQAGPWDAVVGSRYVAGGSSAGLSGPLRRLVSRVASVAPRLLLYPRLGNVRDIASGFFVVRREAVAWERLRPRGFKILLEILARSPGLRATESPFRFEERVAGESKASLREGLRFLRLLVSLFVSEPEAGRIWKFFIVGASGLGTNALAFAAADAAGANAFGAWAAGVETSILTNFALNAAFTFRDRRVFRSPLTGVRAVLLYHIATSAGIAVNAAVFAAFVQASAVPPLISALCSATAGAVTNYLLANRLAFAKQRLGHVLPVVAEDER